MYNFNPRNRELVKICLCHELPVPFGNDLLKGSTIILCAGFEQNNNRWINIESFSGSFACFMRTPRVQASGVGPESLEYVK